MSSIIDSSAFFKLLPQLDGNSTLQGTVTALYEIGTPKLNLTKLHNSMANYP